MATYRLYHAGILALPPWTSWSQFTPTDSFRAKCLAFEPQITNAMVENIEHLQAGDRARLPYRDVTCGGSEPSDTVAQDTCRVALYVSTSAKSRIHFEAWLPKSWDSRFLAIGNGGLGGCQYIYYCY
jgi:feruloyl esterase